MSTVCKQAITVIDRRRYNSSRFRDGFSGQPAGAGRPSCMSPTVLDERPARQIPSTMLYRLEVYRECVRFFRSFCDGCVFVGGGCVLLPLLGSAIFSDDYNARLSVSSTFWA